MCESAHFSPFQNLKPFTIYFPSNTFLLLIPGWWRLVPTAAVFPRPAPNCRNPAGTHFCPASPTLGLALENPTNQTVMCYRSQCPSKRGLGWVWAITFGGGKAYRAGRWWTSDRTRTAAAAARWGDGREWKGRRWQASSSGPALASRHCTGSGGLHGLGGEKEIDEKDKDDDEEEAALIKTIQ